MRAGAGGSPPYGGSAAPEPAPSSLTGPARALRGTLASGVLRTATLLGLCAALFLLPFEGVLVRSVAPRFFLTDLEIVGILTVAAWIAGLTVDRRLPRLPRSVGLALLALLGVTVAATAAAGLLTATAIPVTARGALALALFATAADLVRQPRVASRLVMALLAGATTSALVGFVAMLQGSAAGLPGAGRLFTVAGVPRMAGTFDYPTIAAAAWEVTLLAALPLLLAVPLPLAPPARLGRSVLAAWLRRFALAAALAIVGVALLLTLSRGALLGLAAGLGVLLVTGLVHHNRRLLTLAAGTAGLVTGGAVALYLTSPIPLARVFEEGDRALYQARFAVTDTIVVAPGVQISVPVTVTNMGQSTWRPDGDHPFTLASIWLDPLTRSVLTEAGPREPLTAPVEPGDSATLRVTLVGPAAVGRYLLAWDMRQMGVTWFSEKGSPVVASDVIVATRATNPFPHPEHLATSFSLYPRILPAPTRGQLWSAALAIVRERPLLGVGPGAYRKVYGRYLGWSAWDTQLHSNNLYLELAATTGLLGIGAFLALVVSAVVPQVRRFAGAVHPIAGAVHPIAGAGYSHAGAGDSHAGAGDSHAGAGDSHAGAGDVPMGISIGLRAGLLAAMAATLTHGFVDYFLVFVPIGILFWVTLGIGLGLSLGHTSGRE